MKVVPVDPVAKAIYADIENRERQEMHERSSSGKMRMIELEAMISAIRMSADEAQRSGNPIAMGNALLRIRRIIDGVEE